MSEHMFKEVKKESARKSAEQEKITPASPELDSNDIVNLQRVIGNQGVQRLLAGQRSAGTGGILVQTKLQVGPADDQYEQEADKVAHEVMTKAEPVQRQSPEEEEMLQGKRVQRQQEEDELAAKRIQRQLPEEEELEMKRVQRASDEEEEMAMKRVQRQEEDELEMKRIQRQSPEEEEMLQGKRVQRQQEEDELAAKRIQRKGTEAGFEVEGEVEESIKSAKGSGQSLPDEARNTFESHFGQDFNGVKVHADAQADSLNRSLDARAFTTGSDIFFREGEYKPDSQSGQELLAHELTHVVQQGGSIAKKDQGEE